MQALQALSCLWGCRKSVPEHIQQQNSMSALSGLVKGLSINHDLLLQGDDCMGISLREAEAVWKSCLLRTVAHKHVQGSFGGLEQATTNHTITTAAGEYSFRVLEFRAAAAARDDEDGSQIWAPAEGLGSASDALSGSGQAAATAADFIERDYSQARVLAEGWRAAPDAPNGSGRGPAAAAAQTVMFLHGFMGGAADWSVVAAGLSPCCRCLAVDLPGHGGTRVRPSPPQGTPRETDLSGTYLSYFFSRKGSSAGSVRILLMPVLNDHALPCRFAACCGLQGSDAWKLHQSDALIVLCRWLCAALQRGEHG
jgi:hypothetical protein